nr:MarR family transcriptional regulator [Lactiplantibacillus herbarum]
MNHDEMVARQVLILARQITRRRNQHLRNLELTTEQADALNFFASYPDSTVTTFKTRQGITHQTARLIVQRLATRGYVQLTASPNDGRAKQVTLTASGRAKREQLQQHGWQTSAQMFTDFNPEQQQLFLSLLQQANQNLESDEN